MSALREAILARDLDALESALAAGEEPVFGTLTLAAATGDADLVRRLLRAGAFADAATLCKAAELGHVEVIYVLVRGGVAPDRTMGSEAVTPLMYAAARGQLGSLEALVSVGASLRRRDRGGRTALDVAEHFGQDDAARWLRDRLPIAPDPNDTP
jgi:ankyrin repeat protein